MIHYLLIVYLCEDTLSGFSVSVSEERTSGRIGSLVQENYFSSAVSIVPINPIGGSEASGKISKNKDNNIQKNNRGVGKQNSLPNGPHSESRRSSIDQSSTITYDKSTSAVPRFLTQGMKEYVYRLMLCLANP